MSASSQDAPGGAPMSDSPETAAANELEDLRARVNYLSRLIDVSALVSSSLNLKEVMNRIMVMAMEMMEAEAASIMLWNEE
ncbi:MAG: hypothetical protein VCE91_15775, partial [Nitrospinota bacterium]